MMRLIFQALQLRLLKDWRDIEAINRFDWSKGQIGIVTKRQLKTRICVDGQYPGCNFNWSQFWLDTSLLEVEGECKIGDFLF